MTGSMGDKVTIEGASLMIRRPCGGFEWMSAEILRGFSELFEMSEELLDPEGVLGISSGLALESPSEVLTTILRPSLAER